MQGQPPGKEGRRAPRQRHDSVLELSDDSGRPIECVARLADVSALGARFSSVEPLSEGQRIRARLRLLKEGVLDVRGRIVWKRPKKNTTHYGVEFDAPDRI